MGTELGLCPKAFLGSWGLGLSLVGYKGEKNLKYPLVGLREVLRTCTWAEVAPAPECTMAFLGTTSSSLAKKGTRRAWEDESTAVSEQEAQF